MIKPALQQRAVNASSIAYLGNGLDTPYLDGLMQRLGIADQIKGKLIRPEQDLVSIMTAKGEVELGLSIITQIMTTEGVALVGPLPPEIQAYFTFAGEVGTSSKVSNEGRRIAPVPNRTRSDPGDSCAGNGTPLTRNQRHRRVPDLGCDESRHEA